ncbi:MAG: hypothetical protein ACOX33_01330 [Dethiobacteria bacterium]
MSGVNLSVTLTLERRGDQPVRREKWSVLMENNVWRVKPSPRFLEIISGDGRGIEKHRIGS